MLSAVVQLGKCYSGVLAPRRQKLLRRMALATNQAFQLFRSNRTLHDVLRGDIDQTGKVNTENLTAAGFQCETFIGRKEWETFGIFLPKEERDFLAAKEMLKSMAEEIEGIEGIHRRVLFAMWGIKIPRTVGSLTPNMYASLLARVHLIAQDPRLENISEIRLTRKPLGLVAGVKDNNVLTLSFAQLEEHPFISHIISLNYRGEDS
jgi:hypothetical protein